jgi:hypothetical protein
MNFHDRVLHQARAMGVQNARLVHRRSPRPLLIGTVDGIGILLGLPACPRDLSRNYFNCLRDLRQTVATARKHKNNPGA